MVGSIDVKWKGSTSVGYWVNYVPSTLTSLIALALDFQGQILKLGVSQQLFVWLMWSEKEANQLHTVPTVWPCPLTKYHSIDLEFPRSKFEIA